MASGFIDKVGQILHCDRSLQTLLTIICWVKPDWSLDNTSENLTSDVHYDLSLLFFFLKAIMSLCEPDILQPSK